LNVGFKTRYLILRRITLKSCWHGFYDDRVDVVDQIAIAEIFVKHYEWKLVYFKVNLIFGLCVVVIQKFCGRSVLTRFTWLCLYPMQRMFLWSVSLMACLLSLLLGINMNPTTFPWNFMDQLHLRWVIVFATAFVYIFPQYQGLCINFVLSLSLYQLWSAI
jgi:hypothetical protein